MTLTQPRVGQGSDAYRRALDAGSSSSSRIGALISLGIPYAVERTSITKRTRAPFMIAPMTAIDQASHSPAPSINRAARPRLNGGSLHRRQIFLPLRSPPHMSTAFESSRFRSTAIASMVGGLQLWIVPVQSVPGTAAWAARAVLIAYERDRRASNGAGKGRLFGFCDGREGDGPRLNRAPGARARRFARIVPWRRAQATAESRRRKASTNKTDPKRDPRLEQHQHKAIQCNLHI